nr:YcnI family protein [Sinomonas mesophila]
MLAGAGAASAHVGVDPSTTEAGGYALLSFGVPHGCGSSPTTKVAISLPAELTDATPTVNANWTVEKVTEKLDRPQILADGSKVTERTGAIVYSAETPLDAHLRDEFVLSVKLPADAAGKTLYFPTLQTCADGQTDWAEIPAAGQDPHDLDSPAPSVAVTAAETASTEAAVPADGGSAAAGSAAAGWAGLAAGLAGLGLGGVALYRTRSRGA